MNIKNTIRLTPVAGGGSDAVDVDTGVEIIYLEPATSIILSAPYSVTVSGTPRLHQEIRVIYGGGITTSSPNVVNVFGTALTDNQALYEGVITLFYNGSAWEFRICTDLESGNRPIDGGTIGAGTIPTDAYADDSVSNAKLANISEGSVKVGGSSDAPTDLDVSASGAILIGNGTGVSAQTVSGDLAVDPATGDFTIQPNSIETSMLNFTLSSYLEANVTITSAQILAGCTAVGGAAVQVIPAPGTNKLIEIISCTGYANYSTAAYTNGGTLELTSGDGGLTIASASAALLTTAAVGTEQFALDTPLLASGLNTAIFFDNASAAFTVGGYDLRLSITYRIIDFS